MHAKVHNRLPRRLVLSISTLPLPDHGGAASRNARRGYRIKIVPCRGCWKTQDDSYDSGVTPLLPPPLAGTRHQGATYDPVTTWSSAAPPDGKNQRLQRRL